MPANTVRTAAADGINGAVSLPFRTQLMHRRLLRVIPALFAFALLAAFSASALAVVPQSAAPTLFSIRAGTPRILAEGAQKSWPVTISENTAMDAVFKGGMWLPSPDGGRVYATYEKHIIHANGTWSWIGKVQTAAGPQSVVLTFGQGAVFGVVPQPTGYPLRIVTEHGQTRVVQTSAEAMARSPTALRLRSQPDYLIPPAAIRRGSNTPSLTAPASAAVQDASATRAAARTTAQADGSSSATTVDVMVVYTPGFVSETGSVNAALTRIQYLVDYTNQAYVNSSVNAQIRLVHTMQVDYPDNTSNDSALDDITGLDGNGNTVPIPPSLQGVAPARVQYGADLVAMVRSFDNTDQGNCGTGWLIGGGEQPITTADNVYGYSVVSDGTSGGYFCLDSTFAHELGHNMGNAHDRAHADGPGAYPYSYGYTYTTSDGSNGFATIMAYGTDIQTPIQMFSNPDVTNSLCLNTPCGVPDSSSQSADNAHSMNNTVAIIAQFEPTMVSTAPRLIPYVHDDVNGDGKSDLLWRSLDNSKFAYWIMNGTQLESSLAIAVPTNYKMLATGDFNGDGYMDIVWTDGTSMWMWVGSGSTFTNTYMRAYPTTGWTVVGAADFDGDGDTDLLWAKNGQLAEWLMSGASLKTSYVQVLPGGWRYLTTGDFDGDGRADLLLTNGSAMQMWMQFNKGTFMPVATHTYPPGWTLLGSGDVNGDGMDDLLWRDNAHTRFAYWIMNGPQLAASLAIYVSPQWQFGATGDYDGSGLLGFVWYNKSEIVMWPGSSTGNYKGVVVHSYPSAWTMLP